MHYPRTYSSFWYIFNLYLNCNFNLNAIILLCCPLDWDGRCGYDVLLKTIWVLISSRYLKRDDIIVKYYGILLLLLSHWYSWLINDLKFHLLFLQDMFKVTIMIQWHVCFLSMLNTTCYIYNRHHLKPVHKICIKTKLIIIIIIAYNLQ